MIAAGRELGPVDPGYIDPWESMFGPRPASLGTTAETSSSAAASTPAATGTAQPADSAIGDLGISMGISGAAQACQAIGQMVNGIVNYFHQSKMIEIGEGMAKARLTHQDNMAQINRDMQLNVVRGQEQKMTITRDGKKELNEAVYERKKAEDSLKIAEAKEKEMKLTEKTGKTKSKALDKLFGQYSYGNPISA